MYSSLNMKDSITSRSGLLRDDISRDLENISKEKTRITGNFTLIATGLTLASFLLFKTARKQIFTLNFLGKMWNAFEEGRQRAKRNDYFLEL